MPTTRQNAYRTVIIPMVVTLIVSALILFFTTVKFAYSLLLGGVCWFFPHLYVAYKLFHKIETNPKQYLIDFIRTEITKLLFVAVLFIAIIKWVPFTLAGWLAGYLCAQLLFWIIAATST